MGEREECLASEPGVGRDREHVGPDRRSAGHTDQVTRWGRVGSLDSLQGERPIDDADVLLGRSSVVSPVFGGASTRGTLPAATWAGDPRMWACADVDVGMLDRARRGIVTSMSSADPILSDPTVRPQRGPAPARGKPWDPADEPLRRWESLIERQIRDAQDAGAFDDLPFRGEPLPPVDDAFAGERASAFRILRNHGVAPGWIESDKEIRALLAQRSGLLEQAQWTAPLSRRRLRHRLEEVVRAHNAAVLRLNHEAPTMRQHRSPLDLAADLAWLDTTWRATDAPRR